MTSERHRDDKKSFEMKERKSRGERKDNNGTRNRAPIMFYNFMEWIFQFRGGEMDITLSQTLKTALQQSDIFYF
jgi:hypothetical protein